MKKPAKNQVIVRAYSGVFYGTLVEKRTTGESMEVDLRDAIHIWNWQSIGLPRKALTVEDLALIGAGTGSKVSGKAASLTLADVKVIVSASPEACARIEALPCA
jgi:hypothetical protein